MDLRERSKTTFAETRVACGLTSGGNIVIRAAIAILVVGFLAVWAGKDAALSQGQVVAFGVAAFALVFAAVFGWKFFDCASFCRRQGVLLYFVSGAVLVVIGIGLVAYGAALALPPAPNADLTDRINGLQKAITDLKANPPQSTWAASAEEKAKEPNFETPLGWNFERPGMTHTLGMKAENGAIVVLQFNVFGRNNTGDPITKFRAYVRSDRTAHEFPAFFRVGKQWLLPDQINPIPVGAPIQLYAFFNEDKRTTIPLAQFMSDYVPFTFFVEYNGKTLRRQFTAKELEPEIRAYEQVIRENSIKPPQITAKEAK